MTYTTEETALAQEILDYIKQGKSVDFLEGLLEERVKYAQREAQEQLNADIAEAAKNN